MQRCTGSAALALALGGGGEAFFDGVVFAVGELAGSFESSGLKREIKSEIKFPHSAVKVSGTVAGGDGVDGAHPPSGAAALGTGGGGELLWFGAVGGVAGVTAGSPKKSVTRS